MDVHGLKLLIVEQQGLTVVDDHTLAFINDNGFALSGELDLKTGMAPLAPNQPTTLGVLTLDNVLEK
jgi:hypothetical protein